MLKTEILHTSLLVKKVNKNKKIKKCNSLNKKAKKSYFQKATKNVVMNNKLFWNTVKPFI